MDDENGDAESGGALVEGPAGRIDAFLTEHGVEHEIVEHEETMSALAEAREAEVAAVDTAKGVLLVKADEYLLAVIPASHRLDLRKVRKLIGRKDVRLATEAEMPGLSPNIELGALPVLGPDVPATELVDERLLAHQRIICSAGDHRHAVRFPPGALLELMDPIIADICEDD